MGKAAIYAGSFVKLLKDQLLFKDSFRFLTGTDDPRLVAQEAEPSSLYFKTDTAEVFLKQDSGLSVNWRSLAITDALELVAPTETGTVVIKGGYIILDDGRRLATYDGSGTTSGDFGKDLSIDINTLDNAQFEPGFYTVAVDLELLPDPIQQSDTNALIYPVESSALTVIDENNTDDLNLTRYIPLLSYQIGEADFTEDPGAPSNTFESSDPNTNEAFGNDVDTNDNKWVVVGEQSDDAAASNAGAIHFFEKTGLDAYTHRQKIEGSSSSQLLGFDVRINNNNLAVATTLTTLNNIFVYRLDGSTWVQDANLSFGFSGFSVDMAEDRDLIVVGSDGSPSAFVAYERVGGNWSQVAGPPEPVLGDEAGKSVAVSKDGSVIAVGAPGNDNNSITDNGAVYIYEETSPGSQTWNLTATLTPSGNEGAGLGGYVNLNPDGDKLMAALDTAGAFYVFEDSAGWSEITKVSQDTYSGQFVSTDLLIVNESPASQVTAYQKQGGSWDNALYSLSTQNSDGTSAVLLNNLLVGDRGVNSSTGEVKVFSYDQTYSNFLQAPIRRHDTVHFSDRHGEILRRFESTLQDSVFDLVTPVIFEEDKDSFSDSATTANLDPQRKSLEFDTGAGETTYVSTQLADASFLNDQKDITSVELLAAWKNPDDQATYEVSRDGGSHYQEITMERVGESDTYRGVHLFQHEQRAANNSFTTTTDTAEINSSDQQAIAQEIDLSAFVEPVDMDEITVELSKVDGGGLSGNYQVQLVGDDGSGFPSLSALIVSSGDRDPTALGTSATAVTLNVNTKLQPALYHVVITTDAAYKSSYSAGVDALRIHGEIGGGAGDANHYDGSTWTAQSGVTYAYSYAGTTDDFDTLQSESGGGGTLELNNTDQRKFAHQVSVSGTSVVQKIGFQLEIVGAPSGNVFGSIYSDDGSGNPDVPIAQTNPVPISDINGPSLEDVFDIPDAVLLSGEKYHIVLEADSAYYSSYSAGSDYVAFSTSNEITPSAKAYDGSSWSDVSTGQGAEYSLYGRALDLRLRITAQNDSELDGYGMLYDRQESGIPTSDSKQIEVVHFDAADNLNEFTIGRFLPDPDLLTVYHVQDGTAYRFGFFEIHGSDVVFPANQFQGSSGTPVTLVFDQTRGGSFDNSDENANLLAGNHLGSPNEAIDRSVAGRGIFIRRPDGTLREIALNDNDEIEIYSV